MGGEDAEALQALREGSDPKGVDEFGYTPLHFAAKGGHTEIANIFVERGANVNAGVMDEFAPTPLLLAFEKGHTDTANSGETTTTTEETTGELKKA